MLNFYFTKFKPIILIPWAIRHKATSKAPLKSSLKNMVMSIDVISMFKQLCIEKHNNIYRLLNIFFSSLADTL